MGSAIWPPKDVPLVRISLTSYVFFSNVRAGDFTNGCEVCSLDTVNSTWRGESPGDHVTKSASLNELGNIYFVVQKVKVPRPGLHLSCDLSGLVGSAIINTSQIRCSAMQGQQ